MCSEMRVYNYEWHFFIYGLLRISASGYTHTYIYVCVCVCLTQIFALLQTDVFMKSVCITSLSV